MIGCPAGEAVDEVLHGQVEVHDLVGVLEEAVGDGLARDDIGDAPDQVVEALEVLDVDGREHVDPGIEGVLDVLVALLVLDPRSVGVGELVNQAQLGRTAQDAG